MEKPKSIAIIGGGIAGLSAGIFGQMNGFSTTIYEMNAHPGGVCTSWERQGYSVNGSIHWLIGSAPGSDIYDMWHQLGVVEGSTIHNHDRFMVFRDIDGMDVHWYTNLDHLEVHLLEIAPEDEAAIRAFVQDIRTLSRAKFPMKKSMELFNVLDYGKFIFGNLPAILAMGKLGQIDLNTYAEKFQSPVLQEVFRSFWTPAMSVSFIAIQLAFAHNQMAGYPLGGSGAFTQRLQKRYLDLGGQLEVGQKVTRIRVENDRAVGIELKDNQPVDSDYVVSACDGTTVLDAFLPPEYIPPDVREAYQILEPFPSLLYFSAGVNRTFTDLPATMTGHSLPLPKTLSAGTYQHQRVAYQIYNFDPTLAPEGKTLITAMIDTDYESWKKVYGAGHDAYQGERQRIAQELVAGLEKAFPGISDQIEFMDAATPITYQHWTGNHKGSYEGWLPTPEAQRTKVPTHFRGLDRFYMSGHWVTPGGGMPPAAYSGRNAIQLICRNEGQAFRVRTY